jgi:hypothetical protein
MGMAEGPSKKIGVTCGIALLINSIVALASLYLLAPHLLMGPWLLASGGFEALLGI